MAAGLEEEIAPAVAVVAAAAAAVVAAAGPALVGPAAAALFVALDAHPALQQTFFCQGLLQSSPSWSNKQSRFLLEFYNTTIKK